MSKVNQHLLPYGVTDNPTMLARLGKRPLGAPKVLFQPLDDRSRYPGWRLRQIRREARNFKGELRR